jgi:transposase InsO family protein
MSAKGNPYDNAKAESFFKTLKRQEVYLKDYQTFAEAEGHLAHFIEAVYTAKRLHSSLEAVRDLRLMSGRLDYVKHSDPPHALPI